MDCDNSVLAKVQRAADKANAALERIGVREHSVTLLLPARAGKNSVLGRAGVRTDIPIVIEPRPEVNNVSVRLVVASSGVIEMGDISVKKISRNSQYAPHINDPEVIWLISGPSFNGNYSLVGGTLKMNPESWEAVLRKILE